MSGRRRRRQRRPGRGRRTLWRVTVWGGGAGVGWLLWAVSGWPVLAAAGCGYLLSFLVGGVLVASGR